MNDNERQTHVNELRFQVPGMTCDHCVVAVTSELTKLPGIMGVDIDLATKSVVVTGTELDRTAVWDAVDEAGYEAVA